MKKLFTIFVLFLISIPAFAGPGEYTILPNGIKICDTSEQQAYFEKLEKAFFKKHPNSNFTGEQYDKEVRVPLFNYEAQLQKKGYCGYNNH